MHRWSDADFLNQWYPVLFSAHVSTERPTAATIFERPLVLFKDQESNVQCLQDTCPHRLAPLSTGRIAQQDGQTVLECSYHGWQFSGCGTCVRLPQLEAGKEIRPNYHANAYPVQEVQGIVFVFLGDEAKAAEVAVPYVPELDQEDWIYEQDYMRDLPYDYTTLVENIIDPSHVPVSHHGTVQGNRALAQPLETKIRSLANSPIGFEGVTEVPLHASARLGFKQTKARQRVLFSPSLLQYHFSVPAGDACALFYPVPTARGSSRVLVRRGRNFATERRMGRAQLLAKHLENNIVFDQDMAFLRGQEGRLQAEAADGWGGAWRQRYVMPVEADRFVITFRKQLTAAADALPWRSSPRDGGPPPLPRRQLLDRFEQHTRGCPSCSAALAHVEQLTDATNAARALSAMATIVALASPTAPAVPFWLAGTGATALLSAALLRSYAIGPVVSAVPNRLAAAPAVAAALCTLVGSLLPSASRALGVVMPAVVLLCAEDISSRLRTLRDRFIYTEEAKAIQDS